MAIAFLLFTCLLWQNPALAHEWKTLDEGLSYTATKDLHVFRVNPKRFRFRVVQAKDYGKSALSAKSLAQQSKALLVINGGFFDKTHKSLGLLVNDGQELNGMHPTDWWHLFQFRKNEGKVVSKKHFILRKDTEMALQAGPRLVVNNRIPKLKFSLDRRSGVGIHKSGDILLAVSNETEISLAAFAQILNKPEREGGFDVAYALNLDGGSSSQLYFHGKDFNQEVRGFHSVPNGIGVFQPSIPAAEIEMPATATDSSN